jgi:hypothetical protein
LPEAIACAAAVRRLGYDAVVCVGFEVAWIGQPTPLHAWGECGGTLLAGGDLRDFYEVIESYPRLSVA